ncbi:hypothetical protein TruAng_006888 [Truncatella angustata]|nr:hypothetical protein TruAng_006888 [Truncatella angustata]
MSSSEDFSALTLVIRRIALCTLYATDPMKTNAAIWQLTITSGGATQNDFLGLRMCAGQIDNFDDVDENNFKLSVTGDDDGWTVTDQDNKVWTYKVPTKFQQTSLITIDIVFGNGAIVLPPRFPLPAFKQGSQTRIPRKPSYVEIIVPVTNPLHAEPLSDFIYPVILGPDSLPTVLNGWHQNLSALITLDVEVANQKHIEFMAVLAYPGVLGA